MKEMFQSCYVCVTSIISIPDEMENTLTDLMESENAYYVSDENTVNASGI